MKNIALLLLLFAHFHLSVHTVISGPNDAAEKEPMARAAGRFASSGGHGAHGGGHAGHGHGGGNEGSHGSGHRDNDPTWWRQYHSGYPNNHSKASSSRSFARLFYLRNAFTSLNIESGEKEEVNNGESEAGEKGSPKKEAGDAEMLLKTMPDDVEMLLKTMPNDAEMLDLEDMPDGVETKHVVDFDMGDVF
ncbi:hypothetical protein AAC387_Pa12g0644 [Persea americana]